MQPLPLPALNEEEEPALATVDIPDDMCKARAHYVAHNCFLKVLVPPVSLENGSARRPHKFIF